MPSIHRAVIAILKRNAAPIRVRDFLTISAALVPGLLFAISFGLPTAYPWQLWCVVVFGTIGAAANMGDWLFHRHYAVVGPEEHKSHLYALATGGIPLTILMLLASLSARPHQLLIPVIVVFGYLSAWVAYDEFVFHRKRCQRLEATLHRIAIFGNACAWLGWVHWCFVERATNG